MNNRNPRPRGLPTLLSMLILAAAATASAAPQAADPGASIDSDWVLKILARPAPMRTNFVELRASRLLKEPLRLSGEYQRPDEDTLVRQVRVPYVETTTITTDARSEEHTSELQSLMRISYAVFCLKKKTKRKKHTFT